MACLLRAGPKRLVKYSFSGAEAVSRVQVQAMAGFQLSEDVEASSLMPVWKWAGLCPGTGR